MSILVLSDNHLFGGGLAHLIGSSTPYQAVHVARAELARSTRSQPELVLIDGADGGSDVVTALNGVSVAFDHVPVGLLCVDHGAACVACSPPAVGCVPRCLGEDHLARSLDHFRATGRLDPTPARAPAPPRARAWRNGLLDSLTPREAQILDLLTTGLTSAEIGSRLGISMHTVRTHLQNLMGRLGTRSKVQAIALAQAGKERRNTDRPHSNGTESRPDGPWPVLLVHRHPLDLAAWSHAVDAVPGLTVAAACTAARDAVWGAAQVLPAVAVVHADVAGDMGAVCEAIKASDLPTRLLIVSDRPDPAILESAMEAGADGYLAGDCSIGDFVAAIRKVGRGDAHVPPAMLGGLLRALICHRREEDAVVGRFSRLTPTERVVLSLLGEGLDHHDIARALVISPHTARTHIQNVIKKFGVHSRLEAVTLSLKYGLTERFGGEQRD